jgi:hypothetical protein
VGWSKAGRAVGWHQPTSDCFGLVFPHEGGGGREAEQSAGAGLAAQQVTSSSSFLPSHM